jgi:hypothetical protein
MKSLKSKRAGWAVLLTFATAAVAATVFVATGAAGKSSLTYVNVGAAAFVPETSGCVDYNHDGYSGALVDGDGCDYVAHIDLPDGMKMGNITAYYNNTDGNADFRFEASNDVGDHNDIVDDSLDGTSGDEGGAVCDGDGNCSAIWDRTNLVTNTSTHYGIWLSATCPEGCGFTLYRFKIKLKPA